MILLETLDIKNCSNVLKQRSEIYIKKMKVCVVILATFLGLVLAFPDDKYTTKYDNIDLDAILNNDRLLNNYVNCLLEKGNCTPDGAELKRVLREALDTDCAKCSENQKNGARKVIHFMIKNKRDTWNELQAKYDPENKYVTRYRGELEAEGIAL